MFKREFGFKKSEEIDLQQISSEIEKSLKQKMKNEIDNKIKETLEDIQKLKEEKIKVSTLLQTEKKRFSNLQIEESTVIS